MTPKDQLNLFLVGLASTDPFNEKLKTKLKCAITYTKPMEKDQFTGFPQTSKLRTPFNLWSSSATLLILL